MRVSISALAIVVASSIVILPPERVFAHGSNGATPGGDGPGHLGKSCDTQATEQKLSGDDRRAFMQACISHQTAESAGQTNETPISDPTDAPPTQTLSK